MLNLRNKIKRNGVLLSNIGSLSVVQFINFLIPLITLPYIVRVLGPSNYGVVSFAIAIVTYITLISDYGFNYTGVRDISVHRDNPEKVSYIFFSILYTKFLLFVISTSLMLILIINIKFFSEYISLYLILLLFVLGSLLYPIWFYQGLEKTKALPLINLIPKAIGVMMIFILVSHPNDLIIYAAIISITHLSVGIIAFVYSFRLTDLKLIKVRFNDIILQLAESKKLFMSNISTNLYTTTNVVILGLLTNETSVGIYSAADKIRIGLQGLIAPISQSVFPKLNYLKEKSFSSFIRFINKLVIIQPSVTFIISILVFVFSEIIVETVLGNQYQNSVGVLRILCWLPFIISISDVYGTQALLTMREDEKFLKVVITASLLSIVLVYLLTNILNEIGTAIGFLITEIYVANFMFIYYKKLLKNNAV